MDNTYDAVAANTMFVAYNDLESQYVVAIAGTKSLFDATIEDEFVAKMKKWIYGNTVPPRFMLCALVRQQSVKFAIQPVPFIKICPVLIVDSILMIILAGIFKQQIR